MDRQKYGDGVRTLEDELGISTSDAQSMVDAGNVVAEPQR